MEFVTLVLTAMSLWCLVAGAVCLVFLTGYLIGWAFHTIACMIAHDFTCE